MKVEVTHKGIRDQRGVRIPVGTVLDVPGNVVPAGMINKVRVLDGPLPDAPLTADTAPVVTMPTPAVADLDKPALVEMLDAAGVEYDKRLGVDKLRELAAGL